MTISNLPSHPRIRTAILVFAFLALSTGVALQGLSGCSGPAVCCVTLPESLFLVLLDSTGINRTRESFPSLRIAYTRNGKTEVLTAAYNQLMLRDNSSTHSPSIQSSLPYIAEINSVGEFDVAVDGRSVGRLSLVSERQNGFLVLKELRFNGVLLQPVPNDPNQRILYELRMK